MGALSRGSLLNLPVGSPFDVEPFRSEPRRVVVARQMDRPTLVLGSTQRAEVVDVATLPARGVEMVRRRGGGGAVYLGPGSRSQLWLDAWIPRADPLWCPDVSVAAEWVGEWWSGALSSLGYCEPGDCDVHRGRLIRGELGDLVCFAGHGAGEVFHRGRKLVGVTQWRARQGALFSSCAYWRWDPSALVDLLNASEGVRAGLARQLETTGVGLAQLGSPVADIGALRDRLIASFADLAR